MAEEPDPEMFEDAVHYEDFMLPMVFRELKRLAHPAHDESVEPITSEIEAAGKQKVRVITGAKLRMSSSERLHDAMEMFKQEAKWK